MILLNSVIACFHKVTVDAWQGCSDVAGLMKSAETPDGFSFYPAAHHPEC